MRDPIIVALLLSHGVLCIVLAATWIRLNKWTKVLNGLIEVDRDTADLIKDLQQQTANLRWWDTTMRAEIVDLQSQTLEKRPLN